MEKLVKETQVLSLNMNMRIITFPLCVLATNFIRNLSECKSLKILYISVINLYAFRTI